MWLKTGAAQPGPFWRADSAPRLVPPYLYDRHPQSVSNNNKHHPASAMVKVSKRVGTRGTEGGGKFRCNVCGADITSTVRTTLALIHTSTLPAASPMFSDTVCAMCLALPSVLMTLLARSASIVPIQHAMTMTCVYHVSPKAPHPTSMIHHHMASPWSSSTLCLYTHQIGARTKK